MSTFAKYPRATTITIYSLGVFLGLLHIFLGLIALTPSINNDYHREMKINYSAFSKSLSFLHDFIDRASLSIYLRVLVSYLQIVFGAALIENGHFGRFGKIGNYGLISTNFVFLLLQLLAGSQYDRLAPTIVFTVLLVTRLLIVEQSSKKLKAGVKTRGVSRVKSPKKNKNE